MIPLNIWGVWSIQTKRGALDLTPGHQRWLGYTWGDRNSFQKWTPNDDVFLRQHLVSSVSGLLLWPTHQVQGMASFQNHIHSLLGIHVGWALSHRGLLYPVWTGQKTRYINYIIHELTHLFNWVWGTFRPKHIHTFMHHIPKTYLCIEGRSLLNLAFVESFAERVSSKACVLVNYLPWLLK